MYKVKPAIENFKKAQLENEKASQILGTLIINDMMVKKAHDGETELFLKVTEDMLNIHDLVHGGVYFTLADATSGACCVSVNKKVVTLNATINYIKPIKLGNMISKGKIVHNGSKTVVSKVDIYNEETNELLCTASFTMFVIGSYQ